MKQSGMQRELHSGETSLRPVNYFSIFLVVPSWLVFFMYFITIPGYENCAQSVSNCVMYNYLLMNIACFNLLLIF